MLTAYPARSDPMRVAAATWALLFAAMSFYWAAGGTVGLETLGAEIEREALARDASAIALVWVTGAAKMVGAVVALVGWRRLVLVIGVLIVLYALANFVQHGLMAAGAIDTPAALGEDAVTWHLALWDPFWLLGGVLFCLAGSSRR